MVSKGREDVNRQDQMVSAGQGRSDVTPKPPGAGNFSGFLPKAGYVADFGAALERSHGWLMKGNPRRFLPLLHKLVEERAGERRLPHSHPALHEPALECSRNVKKTIAFARNRP